MYFIILIYALIEHNIVYVKVFFLLFKTLRSTVLKFHFLKKNTGLHIVWATLEVSG
jgi:predicted PurR-regulated permease PerM